MLKAATLAVAALAMTSTSIAAAAPTGAKVRVDNPATITGAIYIPFEAYNAPQMWKNFNAAETDRDFGYAQELDLNALRVWASYEYWKMAPDKLQANFDQFLAIAKKHGIRILISLFENDGEEPTQANMWATDPVHGIDVKSPGDAIAKGPASGWDGPRGFVTWFMNRYRDNDGLIAIEVMNEPNPTQKGVVGSVPFAQSMFKTAKSLQGSVPLTVGSARIAQAKDFLPLGLDVIEFHQNFPQDTARMKHDIEEAMAVGKQVGKPVWLTEWQRTRPTATGFDDKPIGAAERGVDYSSLAPTVNAYPVATFFWSLMVKRAYLRVQRTKGTVNGMFWPDGSVISLKDARAIANNPDLQLKEKPLTAAFGMEAVEPATN